MRTSSSRRWPVATTPASASAASACRAASAKRLAIARAILKDCPLLVLDEATRPWTRSPSSFVQDALVNLMRNRTAFVIAHRLSTVRRADMILALEAGRIAEIGTHDELIAREGGVYAKLYALQAIDDRTDERETQGEESCRDSFDDWVLPP